MSLNLRCFAALLVSAGAAASMAAAPIAAADHVDMPPQPGSQNASAIITDLEAQAYDDVRINWVNGQPGSTLDTSFLTQCWVTNINAAAGHSGVRTVYVDVACPR